MEAKELYPLKFEPILKDKIWGGNRLNTLFNKKSAGENIGESWELSGIIKDESVVSNGELAGHRLSHLIDNFKTDLVGKKVFYRHGVSFPLLFKLIDANENLSIQVHPGDEMALTKHNSLGKTEMWYVVEADPGAELVIGFKKGVTSNKYMKALSEGSVESLLRKVKVSKGDVLFIPPGLVHAIGKGVVVAEIQQSSDIIYRIYDYKRKDNRGNERELHVEQALEAIDFEFRPEPKTDYLVINDNFQPLVKCDYFTTNFLKFNKPISRIYNEIDSFVVYMCLSGEFDIVSSEGILRIFAGETVLIPACRNNIALIPEKESTLLEVYI